MSENIYQPSLKSEDYNETASYDIAKLFYVAFFGGVIPTVVLGTKNARGLKLDKIITGLMIGIGVVILAAKIVLVSLMNVRYFAADSRYIRWIYRGVCVLLYLGYYWAMKQRFKQHLVTVGTTKPLLKDAIIWIIVGSVAEFILLIAGSMVFRYVL